MTDLANAAGAVAAGYAKTQVDFGAGKSPRFVTHFDKFGVGGVDESHANLRATGVSNVDAATADTNAVLALNGMRNVRYGTGATAGKDSQGKQHTFDAS